MCAFTWIKTQKRRLKEQVLQTIGAHEKRKEDPIFTEKLRRFRELDAGVTRVYQCFQTYFDCVAALSAAGAAMGGALHDFYALQEQLDDPGGEGADGGGGGAGEAGGGGEEDRPEDEAEAEERQRVRRALGERERSPVEPIAQTFAKMNNSLYDVLRQAVQTVAAERILRSAGNMLALFPEVFQKVELRKRKQLDVDSYQARIRSERGKDPNSAMALKYTDKLAQAESELAELTQEIHSHFDEFEAQRPLMLLSEFSSLLGCQLYIYETSHQMLNELSSTLPESAATLCSLHYYTAHAQQRSATSVPNQDFISPSEANVVRARIADAVQAEQQTRVPITAGGLTSPVGYRGGAPDDRRRSTGMHRTVGPAGGAGSGVDAGSSKRGGSAAAGGGRKVFSMKLPRGQGPNTSNSNSMGSSSSSSSSSDMSSTSPVSAAVSSASHTSVGSTDLTPANRAPPPPPSTTSSHFRGRVTPRTPPPPPPASGSIATSGTPGFAAGQAAMSSSPRPPNMPPPSDLPGPPPPVSGGTGVRPQSSRTEGSHLSPQQLAAALGRGRPRSSEAAGSMGGIGNQEPSLSAAAGSAASSSAAGERTYCTAQFDFQGESSTDLSFRAGDRIEVLIQHDSGWWTGRVGNNSGLFPSNYVAVEEDDGS